MIKHKDRSTCEWTQEEYNELPVWAKELVKGIETMRTSAKFYRRQIIAFRTVLHDLCCDNPQGFAFYDEVCKHADKFFGVLEKTDTREERKIKDKVRADVIRETKKMYGCVKSIKGRKKNK